MRLAGMTDEVQVNMVGGVFVGESSPEMCSMCISLTDVGCHPKLSIFSYNQDMPFTPVVGLLSSTFGMEFSQGPDKKPWDHLMVSAWLACCPQAPFPCNYSALLASLTQ